MKIISDTINNAGQLKSALSTLPDDATLFSFGSVGQLKSALSTLPDDAILFSFGSLTSKLTYDEETNTAYLN